MALKIEVTFPPVTAKDVVSRELEIVRGEGEGQAKEYLSFGPNDATGTFLAEDNQVLALRLRDHDDAGNAGEWSEAYSFTATDTIPPGKPGELSAKVVAEE